MTAARRRDAMPRPPRQPEPFDLAGRRVYLVGIGGCGMSGLARLLRSHGAAVSGSDTTPSDVTAALVAEGVEVHFQQTAERIPEQCDLLVASAAIKPDNPQWLEGERRGIRVMLYAEALGACMVGRTGVAIAGTHGKSTTTAMLGAALVDAGLDPSVIVGASCGQLVRGSLGTRDTSGCAATVAALGDSRVELAGRGGLEPSRREHDRAQSGTVVAQADGRGSPAGFRLGSAAIPFGPLAAQPGILVAEACEFNRSFHNLWPTVACITSVEADHLDIYGSLDAVVEAFHEFALLLPPEAEGGRLLIAHDGAHRREVTAGVRAAVETIGFNPEADWVIGWNPRTLGVSLAYHGKPVASWTNHLPGQHNATNAATAVALGILLGGDASRLAASLGAFRGVDRRLQFLGEVRDPAWPCPPDGWHGCSSGQPCEQPAGENMAVRSHSHATQPATTVRVFDDYGHHPTEIDCTLRALRLSERPETRRGPDGQPGRLICVFQPHQHSRTRHLLEEFATSFEQADIVIVPHIYFVRDSQAEKAKISASDLVDRLRQRGLNAMHLYPFEAIVEHLQNLCRPGDTLVVMGAGPVNEVAHGYIAAMADPARHAGVASTRARTPAPSGARG